MEKCCDNCKFSGYNTRYSSCLSNPYSTTYNIPNSCLNPEFPHWRAKTITVDLSNQEHYTKGSIQPWDYIIANDLDFLEGNVVKYITRHKYKGTQKADLEKIKVCVDKIIEGLES